MSQYIAIKISQLPDQYWLSFSTWRRFLLQPVALKLLTVLSRKGQTEAGTEKQVPFPPFSSQVRNVQCLDSIQHLWTQADHIF